MIMSLSPYSNSPVTACFVSVTSTAQGLSKSTFQKMKRECSPDDKPNFSIDKRQRFFIRFCQCCVAFISSNVPAFFLSLPLFSPLNVHKFRFVSGQDESDDEIRSLFEEAESIRFTTEKRRKRRLGPKEWEATLLLTAQGVSACRAQILHLHKPKSSVLQKISTGSGCLQLCAHGPFYQWHEEAVTVSLY